MEVQLPPMVSAISTVGKSCLAVVIKVLVFSDGHLSFFDTNPIGCRVPPYSLAKVEAYDPSLAFAGGVEVELQLFLFCLAGLECYCLKVLCLANAFLQPHSLPSHLRLLLSHRFVFYFYNFFFFFLSFGWKE